MASTKSGKKAAQEASKKMFPQRLTKDWQKCPYRVITGYSNSLQKGCSRDRQKATLEDSKKAAPEGGRQLLQRPVFRLLQRLANDCSRGHQNCFFRGWKICCSWGEQKG
jgi:hypothetical protein